MSTLLELKPLNLLNIRDVANKPHFWRVQGTGKQNWYCCSSEYTQANMNRMHQRNK